MARIELRNAYLRLFDGSSVTAALFVADDIYAPGTAPANGDTAFRLEGTNPVDVGSRFTIGGVDREYYVTAVNNNEVQRVIVRAGSGNFTISSTGTVASPVAAQTTASILWNASASDVQTALEGLAMYVSGDVSVTSPETGVWDIEFTGNFAGTAMVILSTTDVDTAVSLAVTTTTAGSGVANEVQRVVIRAGAGNFTIGYTGTTAGPIAVETTGNIAWNASAATVDAALEALATPGPTDFSVTLTDVGDWNVTFTGNNALTNMEPLAVNNVSLTVTRTVTRFNIGGDTGRIVFTPALATVNGIPVDGAVVTFVGRSVEVKLGDGNLTYTESRELEYVLDRGDLDSVRQGDQVPVALSLDFVWEFITASTGGTPTIDDVLKNIGEAADWESSDADACAPYALDLEIEYQPPCDDADRELIRFADFRWDELEHDLEAASVSVTGRANVTLAAVSRVPQ